MTSEFKPDAIIKRLQASPFAAHSDALQSALAGASQRFKHGNASEWQRALDALPAVAGTRAIIDADRVGAQFDVDEATQQTLTDALLALSPWRKGPYQLGPAHIDSEWRSDLKWQRMAEQLAPLSGRRVLDIGGGNSYFAWRAAAEGAAAVLNVDPTLLFYAQYCAITRYLDCPSVAMLPLTFEELPSIGEFDTVLSMGVLYHRRSPIDHLTDIRQRLRSGGEFVLETLVVAGDADTVLMPPDRYARMRNVWFLPSVAALRVWLSRAGFSNIRLIDQTATTSTEQRSTDWMTFESLQHAMDESSGQTIEGLPAPLRAILVAECS